MATADRLQTLVPRIAAVIPSDLGAIVALTAIVNVVVFTPYVSDTPLRIIFGLPFILFAPGYVAICTLFPERPEPRSDVASDSSIDVDGVPFWKRNRMDSIDWAERLAFSISGSVVIVPTIGYVLARLGYGVTLVPTLLVVSVFTVVVAITAAIRRSALPPERQYRVPIRSTVDRVYLALAEPKSRTDARLNVVLICSIVLAVAIAGFALAAPGGDEGHSALYVLGADENGELVAANYSTTIEHGESEPIVVGIDNEEGETIEYTVVVIEQSVTQTDETSVVDTEEEIDRFDVSIEDGETAHTERAIEPNTTGDNVRIVWLLYRDGDVPTNPSLDNAELSTSIWIDVVDEES